MALEWIVPVIIGAVWILGAILKAKEALDAKPKAVPQRNPGKELDQFLQEIERLRKDQDAKSKQPTFELTDADLDEAPAKPIIVARPVLRTVAPPRPRSSPPPVVRPVATPRVATPAMAPVTAASQRSALAARNLLPVATMLRNPQTLAAAIVLQEILGPPKSRRK